MLRSTIINGERFYAYPDVSMRLFGKVSWAPAYSAGWNNRAVTLFPTDLHGLSRCSMINAAGIREVCAKADLEHLADEILCS